jgi:hypothetical protein
MPDTGARSDLVPPPLPSQTPQPEPPPTPKILDAVSNRLSASSSHQISDTHPPHARSTPSLPPLAVNPLSSNSPISNAATSSVRPPNSPSTATSLNPPLSSAPTTGSRASSKPPSKFKTVNEEIVQRLLDRIQHKDTPALKFAPAGTAEEVLDDDTLRELMEEELGPEKTRQLIKRIKERKLHDIVAILIHARWYPDDLESLERHFGQPDLADLTLCDLPFSRDKAINLFRTACGDRFYDCQDNYLTHTIVQRQRNVCGGPDSKSRRLPIIHTEKIAGGAGGDVFKVQIAKGGWQYSDGNTNRGEKSVAQKVFNRGSLEDREDMFNWEVRIYDIIQRTTKYENLAECYGSLKRIKDDDIEYSIFLPLADCSLETLLTKQEWHEKTADELCKYAADLFGRAAGLCEGLHTLHHLLRDENEKPISVLHLDLKPNNILIHRETPKDRAHWQIADYGLSRDKPRQEGLDDTNPLQREGTFVSPEAHLGNKLTVVSDLWCLAAVLLEVCTCILGGPELVMKFRSFRKVMTKNVWQDQFFVVEDGDEGKMVRPNPQIALWCVKLREIACENGQAFGETFSDALTFLEQKLLLIEVEERGKTQANTVRDELFEISGRLKAIKFYPPPIVSTSLEVEIPGLENPPATEVGQQPTPPLAPVTSRLKIHRRRLVSLSAIKKWTKRIWRRAFRDRGKIAGS